MGDVRLPEAMRARIERALLFLLLILAMAPLSALIAPAPADAAITVRIGVYENSPKVFADEQGRASGFWGDVVGYIAAQEGWGAQYVPGTWNECLARLENNEIDIMPDVAYTEERAALYSFSSEAVYVSWSRVYAKRGVSIESVLDLEGKNVAVLQGSVNVEGPEGIKKLAGAFHVSCNYIETDGYASVFELLDSGEADAGVVSKDFGHLHSADHDIVETAIIFAPSSLHFAFTRDAGPTPQLMERVDYLVRELKADEGSIYYRAMEDWLGVRPAGQEKDVIPSWVIFTLMVVLGLALVLAGVGLAQRLQVRAGTRALRAATMERRRLEEMDQLKSDLLSMVSHELRTPLSTIKGYSTMLLEYNGRLENEERNKSLESIDRATDRLVGVVDQLLEMSRMDAGLLKLEKELVDPAALIEQAVAEARLREPDQRLEADVPPDLPLVSMDVNRIRQVLDNLIDNALKYATDAKGFTVSARRREGELVFCVADHGPGIPAGELQTIFDRMYRIKERQRPAVHGLGLGLSICKGLVEAHGGRIWAESQPGEGSQFYFTLPLGAQEANVDVAESC